MKRQFMSGKNFGRLTVIADLPESRCQVICTCGKEKTVLTGSLKRGTTTSCGCIQKEIATRLAKELQESGRAYHWTHGMSRTVEWKAFMSARGRCLNPKDHRYTYYGGRGVKFLFPSFAEFYRDLGPRPTTKHSLRSEEHTSELQS